MKNWIKIIVSIIIIITITTFYAGFTFSYNKINEIDNISNKTYIKDFYDYPKHLHRLEIHQNNQEIKDYCDSKNISQDISLIFNQKFLDEMYIAHLSSLLRFTRKRKKIDWQEILH